MLIALCTSLFLIISSLITPSLLLMDLVSRDEPLLHIKPIKHNIDPPKYEFSIVQQQLFCHYYSKKKCDL